VEAHGGGRRAFGKGVRRAAHGRAARGTGSWFLVSRGADPTRVATARRRRRKVSR